MGDSYLYSVYIKLKVVHKKTLMKGAYDVKRIKVRLFICISILAPIIFFLFFIITKFESSSQFKTIILMTLSFLAVISLVLTIKQFQNLKQAKLIIENKIMSIQPVLIKTQDGQSDEQSIDMTISCFGILLDTKVIRFNQGKVHLKTVELYHDYISITYGSNKKENQIRLLHKKIDQNQINDISKKFHFETGIVPKLLYQEN